jgi:hypothetical protein
MVTGRGVTHGWAAGRRWPGRHHSPSGASARALCVCLALLLCVSTPFITDCSLCWGGGERPVGLVGSRAFGKGKAPLRVRGSRRAWGHAACTVCVCRALLPGRSVQAFMSASSCLTKPSSRAQGGAAQSSPGDTDCMRPAPFTDTSPLARIGRTTRPHPLLCAAGRTCQSAAGPALEPVEVIRLSVEDLHALLLILAQQVESYRSWLVNVENAR